MHEGERHDADDRADTSHDYPAPRRLRRGAPGRRAMMPHRTRTRTRNCAQAIADERRRNAEDRRIARQRKLDTLFPNVAADPDDPPPF